MTFILFRWAFTGVLAGTRACRPQRICSDLPDMFGTLRGTGEVGLQKENRPPEDSRAQLKNSQQLPAARALSTSVKEIREEPGMGRFTSYEDGRVRAVFSDRTILEMDPSRTNASILFPDASRLKVNVSNPVIPCVLHLPPFQPSYLSVSFPK